MLCPACQAEVTAESVFCHHCGARLDDQEALLGPHADVEANSNATEDAAPGRTAKVASGEGSGRAADRLRSASDQRHDDDDVRARALGGGLLGQSDGELLVR